MVITEKDMTPIQYWFGKYVWPLLEVQDIFHPSQNPSPDKGNSFFFFNSVILTTCAPWVNKLPDTGGIRSPNNLHHTIYCRHTEVKASSPQLPNSLLEILVHPVGPANIVPGVSCS